MTINTILNDIRQDIAKDILTRRDETLTFNPVNLDPYVSASVLQKAIRRDEETIALRAAARLLESDPDRLWRRLLVIAFEDVGIGSLDIVGKVTAAHGQKRWRSANGGEWAVVALLVSGLCRAIKDRTADDLLHLAENDPRLRDHRRCWSAAPIDKLTMFIANPTLGLPEKTLAVWFGVGTTRYQSKELRERRGFPEEVFAAYKAMGTPDEVLAISWAAHKKMSWPLAAFLPIVWQRARKAAHHEEPDTMPPHCMVGDAPSYALDAYTRSGKAAIRELLRSSKQLRQFLSANAPEKAWPRIASVMLFRVEGGLMTNRLRWHEGNEVYQAADLVVPGLDAEAVPEGLDVLRNDLPVLNAIRKRIGIPNLR